MGLEKDGPQAHVSWALHEAKKKKSIFDKAIAKSTLQTGIIPLAACFAIKNHGY